MYRGIRGTFIYACNPNLREYLKQHVSTYKKPTPFRILRLEEVKPYINSVPLIDLAVAAGNFSDLQIHSEVEWIELPFTVSARKGYFVCQVVGESMNKRIPNGSYCLFKQDEGGSRNGKIVLVESTNIADEEFGSGYTVKEYHSEKKSVDGEWSHLAITLKPLSTEVGYKDIEIVEDEYSRLKVVGIFVQVL